MNTLARDIRTVLASHNIDPSLVERMVDILSEPKFIELFDQYCAARSLSPIIKERFNQILRTAPTSYTNKNELLELLSDAQNLIASEWFISNGSNLLSELVPAVWNNQTFRTVVGQLTDVSIKAKQGKGEFLLRILTNSLTIDTASAAGDLNVEGWSVEHKTGTSSLDPRTDVGTMYHLKARDAFFDALKAAAPQFANSIELTTGKEVVADGTEKVKARGSKEKISTVNHPILWDRKGGTPHTCVKALKTLDQSVAVSLLYDLLNGYYGAHDVLSTEELHSYAHSIYTALGTKKVREILFDINYQLYKRSDRWDSMTLLDPETLRVTNIVDSTDLSEVGQYFSIAPMLYRSGSLEQRDDGHVIVTPRQGRRGKQKASPLLAY